MQRPASPPRLPPACPADLRQALAQRRLGIGATGAANGMGGTNGLIVAIVAWVAIALINIANAVRR